jgi:hypothetical protein
MDLENTQPPSKKALAKAKRDYEEAHQLFIAYGNSKTTRQMRHKRRIYLSLARAFGLPEYELEAKQERDDKSHQTVKKRRATVLKNKKIRAKKENKKPQKQNTAEAYYLLCRKNGYTHERALEKTATKYGRD